MFELGEPATLTIEVRDSAGALANATAVTLAVTLPDGTTTAPSVVNSSTGVYTAVYTTVQVGRHLAVWTATGVNAGIYSDAFLVTGITLSVQPLVSLLEIKTHLRNTATASDEQLRYIALVATDLVERWSGRTWRTTTATETYTGGGQAIALRRTPVASITTVVESGTTLTASDYVLDSAGVLYRGDTTVGSYWLAGQENVTVTYVAGVTDPPPTVVQAVLEVARHLWDTQRGGSQLPRQAGATDDWDPRSAYSMPRRVAELLERHRAPGMA